MVRGVTRDRESARCPVPEIALTITFGDSILTHVVPLPQEPRLRFDFSDPTLKLRDRTIDFCGRSELVRLAALRGPAGDAAATDMAAVDSIQAIARVRLTAWANKPRPNLRRASPPRNGTPQSLCQTTV